MKKSLVVLFFFCAGVVIGTLVAHLTSGTKALNFLSYGLNFGLTSPLVLDLSVLKLSLGLSINLNLSVIIFATIALIIAYKTVYRRRR